MRERRGARFNNIEIIQTERGSQGDEPCACRFERDMARQGGFRCLGGSHATGDRPDAEDLRTESRTGLARDLAMLVSVDEALAAGQVTTVASLAAVSVSLPTWSRHWSPPSTLAQG